MGEAELMHLKHLASSTDSICVLNRMIQMIWHYRKSMNIPWLSCSLNNFRVGAIRLQTFPSLTFAFVTPKAHSCYGEFFFLPPFLPLSFLSFLPSFPSFLWFFFPKNKEVIRAGETGEVFKQSVRLEGFMGFKYKKGGHWKGNKCQLLSLSTHILWIPTLPSIPHSGNTEMNVAHELKWAVHVRGQ